MRNILLATVAVCLLVPVSAFAQTAAAPAAAMPAPAAPAEPIAPRIKGSTNGGVMNQLAYTVACPRADISIFEKAADELFPTEAKTPAGKVAIAKAEGIFNNGQSAFGEYVDCVQTNYNDDRDELIKVLSARLGSTIKEELARIDTGMIDISAALTARAAKGFKAAPKPPKNAPPEVAPVLPTADETKARFKGRFVGSITGGPLGEAAYTSACPKVTLDAKIEDIPGLATPAAFNAVTDRLKTINDQFIGYQDCLNTNANDDLKAADDVMLAGINANVRTDQQALNKALGELQRQITTKKEDAAAAVRPVAKPAAKPAARPAARPAAKRR